MKSRLTSWCVFGVSTSVLIALDLLLKQWAAANLMGQPPRVLVPGFLGLTYHENPGAAFGFLAGAAQGRVFLTIFSILLMAAILAYYHILPNEKRFLFLRIPLILIFAGGTGNLIDRITLGAVRDMLAFLFINFPIFNLADVYVTAGAFSFVFAVLLVVKDAPLFNA